LHAGAIKDLALDFLRGHGLAADGFDDNLFAFVAIQVLDRSHESARPEQEVLLGLRQTRLFAT